MKTQTRKTKVGVGVYMWLDVASKLFFILMCVCRNGKEKGGRGGRGKEWRGVERDGGRGKGWREGEGMERGGGRGGVVGIWQQG